MDFILVFFVTAVVIGIPLLFILVQLFRNLVRKQIDDQIKEIIPVEVIRKRVGIRIKWRK